MKTILTLAIALACYTASAAVTINIFTIQNKDYYPSDTIRMMFQINGTYNNTTPIVFTMKTGPQLGTTLTKNVALGTLKTTVYNTFTYYYYDWVLACDAPVANSSEIQISYRNSSPLVTNIKSTDASHPCVVKPPVVDPPVVDPPVVDPPVTTSTISPLESIEPAEFKVYDVTGVLLKEYYGLYRELNLSAGFYIIQANNSSSFKVRVQ